MEHAWIEGDLVRITGADQSVIVGIIAPLDNSSTLVLMPLYGDLRDLNDFEACSVEVIAHEISGSAHYWLDRNLNTVNDDGQIVEYFKEET